MATLSKVTVKHPEKVKDRQDFQLMLFDLEPTGHHGSYIEYVLKFWCEEQLQGHLNIVVSPELIEQHPHLLNFATQSEQKNICFIAIKPEEAQLPSPQSFTGRIKRAFQEWQLLQKYTSQLQPDHCLLLFLDSVLLRFGLGAKLPCPFSAIYFRPIFHYSQFPHYQPSLREKIWHWRDKLCLSTLLKSPQLEKIFSLDPFAVKPLQDFNSSTKIVHLPDPVEIINSSQSQAKQLKSSLGIESGRRTFLLFGLLAARKGIYQLLEALPLLSSSLQKKLTILLVGVVASEDEAKFSAQVSQLSQTLGVQIICHHEFISEAQIQLYYQLTDVILAPYQRHVGMSGILVRAAAAGKPVLSTNYGLMGEITRRYELGLTVDATQPQEITQGLEQFLQQSPSSFCNPITMEKLAQQNHAEKFTQVIFNNLLETD